MARIERLNTPDITDRSWSLAADPSHHRRGADAIS